MDEYGMFKQALRGFDKDEVLAYIKQKEDEHGKQIISMERDIRKRDKVISELKSRIVLKDEQVERLEQEIRDKYQKYIDNYNQIGELVYESKVKGNRIIEEAQEEADRILAEADSEARKRIGSVQGEIDAKLKDGKTKYLEVQDEMNEIVDLFNQMQKKFMQSYKEVHEIIQSMPASLDDMDLGLAEEELDDSEALDEDDLDLGAYGIQFPDMDDTEEFDEEFQAELKELAKSREKSESGSEPADAKGVVTEEEIKELLKGSDTKGTAYFPEDEVFQGTNAAELLQEGNKA